MGQAYDEKGRQIGEVLHLRTKREVFDHLDAAHPGAAEIRIQQIAEEAKRLELGATGRFPDGKLDESDDGEIRIGVTVKGPEVIVHFGTTPVTWIGLTPFLARSVAATLQQRADEAERSEA